jgi:hypothetical protein
VFSRYEFSSYRVLEHSHHPIDWEAPAHPLAAKEPRKGRRTTLVADVAAPGGAIRVYCTHLEVFCGILGRAWQFSDILRDVKESCPAEGAAAAAAAAAAAKSTAAAAVAGSSNRQQQQEEPGAARVGRFAILGDLNTVSRRLETVKGSVCFTALAWTLGSCKTPQSHPPPHTQMANGVARLSPHYCCDALRWRTLGCSEARYWQQHILSCTGGWGGAALWPAGAVNYGISTPVLSSSTLSPHRHPRLTALPPFPPSLTPGSDPGMANAHFRRLGLPESVCRDLVNPGLFDPFDVRADITLDNPAYRWAAGGVWRSGRLLDLSPSSVE